MPAGSSPDPINCPDALIRSGATVRYAGYGGGVVLSSRTAEAAELMARNTFFYGMHEMDLLPAAVTRNEDRGLDPKGGDPLAGVRPLSMTVVRERLAGDETPRGTAQRPSPSSASKIALQ